ncbi:MAG: efflux RND transporter periplasmic adaptor subunit [Fimbriimonas ginsengisoli]|uniref:Efflux RND transporter periplasmic adaptor subunit n=1 Tax=Fimbriimonas ginsengisoli TaxID=1005039 RepID=A0A931M045_FIMGI|nr:efflux RND transporter periplasmic adaptor subunit [Fimbriimonas ginsengisoli]
MNTTITFLKKHWLTLALLGVSLGLVRWVVATQRSPGSMSFVDAQSMDMTTMRAPAGATPVTLAAVKTGSVADERAFPATVAAFGDEDVVARLPGRVQRILVYPGDRVRAGQLLAVLDAPDALAAAAAGSEMALAKAEAARAAELTIGHHRAIEAAAKATVSGAYAGVDRSKAESEAVSIDLSRAKADVETATGSLAERQADLEYADKQLARMQKLYEAGAISLNEFQAARRERDAARGRLASTQGQLSSSRQAALAAERRLQASKNMIQESSAMLRVAQAQEYQATQDVTKVHREAAQGRYEAGAARAQEQQANAVAGFRELRALGDGVVAERSVSPGTAVQIGQVVLRLKSGNALRVQADLPEALSATAHLGVSVRILSEGPAIEARLTSVFPTVDPATRTFRVEALVPTGSSGLKPGMFARLAVPLSEPKNGLVAPLVAVREGEQGKFVWLAQAGADAKTDWTCTMHPSVSKPGPGKCPICGMDLIPRSRGGHIHAHRVPVRVLASNADQALVECDIHAGDQVVSGGGDDLVEGSALRETGKDAGLAEPGQTVPGHEGHTMPMPAEPKATTAPHPHQASQLPGPKVELSATAKGERWVCPMDGYVGDRPGACPKCGMALKRQAA